MSNFKIAQNMDNAIEFTIKAKGSILPIVIDPADTFLFKLVDKDMNVITTASNIAPATSIVITDAANGLITINIPKADTVSLVSSRRDFIDGATPVPNYSATLEMTTVALGNVRAYIPLVEVVPDGISA